MAAPASMYFAGLLGATDGGNSVFSDAVFTYTELGGAVRNDVITTGSHILHGKDEIPAVVIWVEQREVLVNPTETEPTELAEGSTSEAVAEPTLRK